MSFTWRLPYRTAVWKKPLRRREHVYSEVSEPYEGKHNKVTQHTLELSTDAAQRRVLYIGNKVNQHTLAMLAGR